MSLYCVHFESHSRLPLFPEVTGAIPLPSLKPRRVIRFTSVCLVSGDPRRNEVAKTGCTVVLAPKVLRGSMERGKSPSIPGVESPLTALYFLTLCKALDGGRR